MWPRSVRHRRKQLSAVRESEGQDLGPALSVMLPRLNRSQSTSRVHPAAVAEMSQTEGINFILPVICWRRGLEATKAAGQAGEEDRSDLLSHRQKTRRDS